MKKREYIEPVTTECLIAFSDTFLLSASEEGIGDGGDGSDLDDPTAKEREEEWGTLW